MSIKVIGAGFGRTGTMSLKSALEELRLTKCYHMIELINNPELVGYWEQANQGESVDWDVLFDGYQATIDYPSYRHYKTLMQHYPEAKVILTVRDPDSWYESVRDTIYRAAPKGIKKLMMSFISIFSSKLRYLIRTFHMSASNFKKDFSGKFEDRAFAIEVFKAHIEEVKNTVPADKLLVYEVKEGWQPLCDFLDLPVPDKPFPRLNDRAEFKERLKKGFKNQGDLK